MDQPEADLGLVTGLTLFLPPVLACKFDYFNQIYFQHYSETNQHLKISVNHFKKILDQPPTLKIHFNFYDTFHSICHMSFSLDLLVKIFAHEVLFSEEWSMSDDLS